MNEDLRIMIGLYLSTSLSSLIINTYMMKRVHDVAKKDSMRNLVYKKGLSSEAKEELSMMNSEFRREIFGAIFRSMVPVLNVPNTFSDIESISDFEEATCFIYNDIVRTTNDIEDEVRKTNVDLLKSLRDRITISSDIDLDDEETRLTVKETSKILKKNKLKYSLELKKYRKECDE